MPSACTPPRGISQFISATSPNEAKRFPRPCLSRPPSAGRLEVEMTGIVVLSLIAAAGVLLAVIAVAIPAAQSAPRDKPRWEAPSPRGNSLRDRINLPFQALAERSNRQHRLNGGLTIAEHLARADLKLRTSEFVMIQVGFLAAGALLALWRFGLAPQFVLAGVLAYLIPMRYVRWRQRRRLKAFNSRLPDTVSLLSNAMKAGLSLPQAIEAVANNASPPISDELSRVIREMKLGSATPVALANMVRRVGSEDLDLIVTAIGIQSSVGGNLARILDRKSTRLNSSHLVISYAVFCLKKKKKIYGRLINWTELTCSLRSLIFYTTGHFCSNLSIIRSNRPSCTECAHSQCHSP